MNHRTSQHLTFPSSSVYVPIVRLPGPLYRALPASYVLNPFVSVADRTLTALARGAPALVLSSAQASRIQSRRGATRVLAGRVGCSAKIGFMVPCRPALAHWIDARGLTGPRALLLLGQKIGSGASET